MASIENSLKHEAEVEPGKIRLITSGEFVRAYNHSAWLFYCCISKYKVIRKYSKAQQKDVYFLGFPVSKLLELSNGRVCEKTDFGYDITLKPEEVPVEEGYETWTKEVPVEAASRADATERVPPDLDATGRVYPVTLTFKAPIGEMSFEMAADGTFTLKNGNYSMAEKNVGGDWSKSGAKVYVDGGRGATALPAGTIEELLPDGEPVIPKGGKWSFDKAASVKYAKDKATGAFNLVIDDTKGTNRSAMKLTYTPKTGIFKGSFKIYVIQDGKLKKFTVKVIGVVVDGKGSGSATGPNGLRFDVRVE